MGSRANRDQTRYYLIGWLLLDLVQEIELFVRGYCAALSVRFV